MQDSLSNPAQFTSHGSGREDVQLRIFSAPRMPNLSSQHGCLHFVRRTGCMKFNREQGLELKPFYAG